MLILKVFFLKALFLACLFSQNNNHINFRLDTFGQSEFYLDELNPCFQSDFTLGAITLRTLHQIPYASSLMNFDFIKSFCNNSYIRDA